MANLSGSDLISVSDLELAEIKQILSLAKKLKSEHQKGMHRPLLKGKTLAMIFEKPSTRTRVSFEVAMYQLGGYVINLRPRDIQLGQRETPADIARTLSRYVNGIMARTFSHQKVLELANYADIPVINGLSDQAHPCQALSDIFTIAEKKGSFSKLKAAYVGDGNNVCNSLMAAASKVGLKLFVATPKRYAPDKKVAEMTKDFVKVVSDPKEAVSAADVVYTDVWVSMGQEKEAWLRKRAFRGFQINSELMKLAKKDAIVMHCLPAHRNEEITAEVIDGKQSVIFDQAENRLHVQKAILALLLG